VEGVNLSQETARDTSQVIEQIVQEIAVAVQANNRISTVSREQMEQFNLLQGSLERLFDTFNENSAKVETTATIGDDLYRVSENLKGLLSQFLFERQATAETRRHEKRRSPRIARNLRVHIVQGGESYESICHDLSLTGMQLRTANQLNEKTPLRLSVFLPYDSLADYEAQTPLTLKGRIVWQRNVMPGYASGVRFEGLLPEQEQRLEECFRYFNKKPKFERASPPVAAS